MPCATPNLYFRNTKIKQKLRFCGRLNYRDENGLDIYQSPMYKAYSANLDWQPVTLPCGNKCRHCRLKNSQEKGIRCMHEASFHKDNVFLTLTYDDAHLPMANAYSLLDTKKTITSYSKTDPVTFVKDLRAWLSYHRPNTKILTFGCAEYGEKFGRPHFHLIIFGWKPEDLQFLRMSKNDWSPKKWPVYKSELLKKLWPHGFHEIGTVTYESACYVARYVMKKFSGDQALLHYQPIPHTVPLLPERPICVSNKTGIGLSHIKKYTQEILNNDCVWIKKNGEPRKLPVPRYYNAKLLEWFPDQYRVIQQKRIANALKPNLDLTKPRMKDRTALLEHRSNQLKRSYEEKIK